MWMIIASVVVERLDFLTQFCDTCRGSKKKRTGTCAESCTDWTFAHVDGQSISSFVRQVNVVGGNCSYELIPLVG